MVTGDGVDLPTLKEQGLDVSIVNWRGVFAPPQIRDKDKKALDEARERARGGGGSIVNISSGSGVVGQAMMTASAYAASKGGVLAMTRELGVQFARQGIRVNALCPGPVNTPRPSAVDSIFPVHEPAAADGFRHPDRPWCCPRSGPGCPWSVRRC